MNHPVDAFAFAFGGSEGAQGHPGRRRGGGRGAKVLRYKFDQTVPVPRTSLFEPLSYMGSIEEPPLHSGSAGFPNTITYTHTHIYIYTNTNAKFGTYLKYSDIKTK